MEKIPSKVLNRFNAPLKNYLNILESAKSRDVNESDTVKIVNDILADILGYDKYFDLTGEFAIRGTYCDIAVKDETKVRYIVECKAIDTELKESHLKQAIDYAANQGIDWAILTNAISWKIYKVIFEKPIKFEFVFELDFLNENIKNSNFKEKLYLLSKEALKKSAIKSFHEERQIINKYMISAILQSEKIVKSIRKEIRNYSNNLKVDEELISEILINDVLKREVVETEKAKEAIKRVKKAERKANKKPVKLREKKSEKLEKGEIEIPIQIEKSIQRVNEEN